MVQPPPDRKPLTSRWRRWYAAVAACSWFRDRIAAPV